MPDSILTSVKQALNILPTDSSFDQDVIMFVNGAFSDLNQLGVGPDSGFMIEGADETWDAFLGNDPRLNNIKTYIYLATRMLFDPPTTGYLVTAMKEQLQEHAWRINVRREDTEWTPPEDLILVDSNVLDGGVV